ncbi:oligosaccharide flippase family protein [Alteromonas australica]|uniref:oligosaccharide flippase family protein n=1 Tax=Alteromonas australica TaxID=589873 RepID=UPI002357E9B7|nr:oligosaccharide flippase family protein [Alteromonas australica]
MSKLKKATSWTTLSTLIGLALSMIQLAYLVRIISTESFGQFAVLNLVLEVFAAFSLGGISNFLIYKGLNDKRTVNTLFFCALLIGFLFTVILFLLSPYIANAFNIPEITYELRISTSILLITAIASQVQAIALKDFRHKELAIIEILSRVLSFFFAIYYAELGLLCLVGSIILYNFLRLTLSFIQFRDLLIFSFDFDVNVAKEALNYGIYDFGAQSLNILRKHIDVAILAFTLSTSDLGVYHVLRQLAAKPAQAIQPIISKVCLPAFAKFKNLKEKLHYLYIDFYTIQSLVLSFIYVPLIFTSGAIINLFYGTTYLEYSAAFSFLSLFWFIRVSNSSLIGPLVQSLGITKKNFIWNVYMLIPNCLVIFLSSKYGILSLAIMLSIYQALLIPLINIYFIRSSTNTSLTQTVKISILSFLIFAIPLIALEKFLLKHIPNSFFYREIFIAAISLTTLFIVCKTTYVRKRFDRLKEL